MAEKRFTVHDAPAVLTIHLKRFSPLGRKIGHYVHYDERLVLQPAMSEGQHGPSYSLYGIICHAGGGPNSGHYFAHVKAANGRWYEMNDDMVSPYHGAPVGMKNAYILFYMRDRGQSLEGSVCCSNQVVGNAKSTIIGGMKKRKNVDLDEEDIGVKASTGPLLPSPMPNNVGDEQSIPRTSISDPQAVSLQKKIAAITPGPSTALMCLAQYDEDESPESSSESIQQASKVTPSLESPPPPPPSTDSPQSPSSSDHTTIAQIPALASDTPRSSGIDPSSFYASYTDNERKRKSSFGDEDNHKSNPKRHAVSPTQTPSLKHTPHGKRKKSSFGGGAVNPYSRLVGNNTLQNSDFRPRPRQYGHKRKRMII